MPCYGAGVEGDARRDARFLARFAALRRKPLRTLRCPDCERQRQTWDAPDECPDCGRDVADRWHEVQEG